ncbi:mitochondrial ribosomal protein L4 [Volvox carteri f. nagariensis]|uniref:Large ribosomal subunit protein uL4m n=1 Tax=Volvox carteri f. nagariensis TaxID=3068 RepID=D8UHH6_VOLCA|nr:mitochondrial ribosomal protein L4 [Volvox carteri f. nagariensis]EFJ40827.1 mitochondrial ribosomal protein L4 [Volvox carteri f. nagariensis]|eukprot:XP_002958096.1 mitochondrial ribosomal protein L4 [Volvox carteri f. nagariensis]
MSHLILGTAPATPLSLLPSSLQPQRHAASLGSSSLSPSAPPGNAALVPVLRDADDEALSPHPPTTGSSPLTIRYPFAVEYWKDREAVVYSMDEQPLGLVRLPGVAFNVPVRLDILHRVVRYLRAKWQQGTHKAKRRGEVSGGGRKPRPQKKTGRARQGSIRSPLWKGGGVSHAPLPRSHAHKLPRSVRLLGMRCAITAKIHEGRFFVVDNFLRVPGPSGSSSAGSASNSVNALGEQVRVRDYSELKQRLARVTAGSFGSTWLLVDSGEAGRDGGVQLRKWLKGRMVMEVLAPEQLTVYHVLKYHRLVVTRAALESLAEQLTKPHRVRKPAKLAWWLRRKEQLDTVVRELTEAADRSR